MSAKHLKQLSYLIISILLTLGLSLSLQSLLAAWTAPASAPPDNNVSAPINESATNQAKLGGLGIGGAFAVTGNSSFSGNVGIGTTGPVGKLHIKAGASSAVLTGIVLGNESVGAAAGTALDFRNHTTNTVNIARIISQRTTDANSNSTLQLWNFYGGALQEAMRINESGKVGIGTTAPGEKLEVSGNIKLSGASATYKISNVADPTANQDVATKSFVLANAGGGVSMKSQVFTSSGTWTKPSTVELVEVLLVGGGGGGGGSNSVYGYAGSGGGGGQIVFRRVRVTSDVTITIGNGGNSGAAGNPGATGSTGQSSTFGTLITALGGSGGYPHEVGVGGNGGGYSTLWSVDGVNPGLGGAAGNTGGAGQFGIYGVGGGGGGRASVGGLSGGRGGAYKDFDDRFPLASGGAGSISGSYGAGGGGASYGNGANGGCPGSSATANSGGGGGGSYGGCAAGNGGSGYAIVYWYQ